MSNEVQINPVKTPDVQGIPSVFKKPIKNKALEKRFVKHIPHPKDKEFFVGCFTLQEDMYVIRHDLNKEDIKKLKNLLKWVKKNKKGGIKVVPLVFAAAVVGALILFFTIFANPLLERALEIGLEAAFEAKSDVHNFRLGLKPLGITIGGVTVANRDQPMTNLFELGKTKILLKTEAILRGKVYIEEVRCDDIRFGTERTVSGALPGKPPREKAAKEKAANDAPPLIDLKNFDAMALLNQEYDKLNTPKLYDEAINAYNETLNKWQGQVDGAKARAAELQASAQPLLNLNVNSLRDIDTIRKTIEDINTMVNSVQGAADDATNMVNGIEADINNARQLEQNARNALTDDINHLKSYVNLEGGAAFAALEPFIRDVLSDTAEQYLDYGIMALDMLQKIKAAEEVRPKKEKPPKKEPKVVFKGRDVHFPSPNYPSFYLGTLASDITVGSWNGAFDLKNISSNPDFNGRPVTLAIAATEIAGSLKREINFDGMADLSSNATELYNANVSGGGFPVSLGDQLSQAGINGFTGETAFAVNMTGRVDGDVSASGDVKIRQAKLIDPKGTIAEAVDIVINKTRSIDLGIQYTYHVNQSDEFKITTNIAGMLMQALKSIAEAYVKKAMDEIERVLRERISEYIDDKFVAKEDLDALFKIARGDKAAMDQIKNSLDNKKNEFEQKIKGMADEGIQQAKDEASKQTEQAVQDLKDGKAPTLQTPSLNLPGSGGLKLPGRN